MGGIPIIFSTWETSPSICYSEADVVLYNELPADFGTWNYNLQRVSSLNGFMKAKKMGFTRVIKWRSDLIPQNFHMLLELFEVDKINFYSFMNHLHGYVTDFFMEGDIDELIALFSDETTDPPYPEFAFTNKLFELGLDKKANFICKRLSRDGADVFWDKLGYWFSDNVSADQYMDSIKKYCW